MLSLLLPLCRQQTPPQVKSNTVGNTATFLLHVLWSSSRLLMACLVLSSFFLLQVKDKERGQGRKLKDEMDVCTVQRGVCHPLSTTVGQVISKQLA